MSTRQLFYESASTFHASTFENFANDKSPQTDNFENEFLKNFLFGSSWLWPWRKKDPKTPTPRLWKICWLFLCLFARVASRLIFCFVWREKKGFIHKTSHAGVSCAPHSWNLRLCSLLKKSWYITLRLAYAKFWNQFLSRRFEYSMIWSWVSERRLKKSDRSAPNKKRICRAVKARVYVVWIYFALLNSIETPASACTITFRKLCPLTSLILVYNVSLGGLSQRLLLLHVIWF